MIVCKIDNSVHENREEFHKHLRKLKVRQEDYYAQYEPRRDLFSGEPIPFKSVEQYLNAEFLSRDNLRRWAIKNPEKGKEWAVEWLRKRKDEKELAFAPSQVELKSLLCPTKHYYDSVMGYNVLCEGLGLKIQFPSEWVPTQIQNGLEIVQDSREQNPLLFPPSVKVKVHKLNCGDYGLVANNCRVYVERKSITDFVGTLSDRAIQRASGDDSNFSRFTRELQRAKECDEYVIMAVEVPIESALDFPRLPEFRRNWKRKKNETTGRWEEKYYGVGPEHIFHNLRDLLHEFQNFQALFVDGREEMIKAIQHILSAGQLATKCDLQYAYERKTLFPR